MIVRLEVVQNDRDYNVPAGAIFRLPKSGAVIQLFRRKHRECNKDGVGKQTWWVKKLV